MKNSQLKNIIREEIQNLISEEYIDKYRFRGRLITNINSRNQNEILSDIRALPGVTIVSTTEIKDYSGQNFSHFATILNIKVDGYPYIKTGFNRESIKKIADNIRKVPDVISFQYSDESIENF